MHHYGNGEGVGRGVLACCTSRCGRCCVREHGAGRRGGDGGHYLSVRGGSPVLENTRCEAREARAATAGEAATSTDGRRNAVAPPAGKSKAAKRKQQKRKAQQQKKRAAERAAGDGTQAVAAVEGSGTSEQAGRGLLEEGQQATEQEQQLQQDPGGLSAATAGFTLQEEEGAGDKEEKGEGEGEEEEECSVCLCVLLKSEDRGCRLVCQHVYHGDCSFLLPPRGRRGFSRKAL